MQPTPEKPEPPKNRTITESFSVALMTGAAILGLVAVMGLPILMQLDRQKQNEKADAKQPRIETVQDCEQYWERAVKYENHVEQSGGAWQAATLSASESLLYQNCLKRFEKK